MFKKSQKKRFADTLWKWFRGFLGFLGICIVIVCILAYPIVHEIWYETIGTVQLHRNYIAAHSGWSFPGKIYSAPTPLDVPKRRRIAHAKIRGYRLKCPATDAGEYCDEDGEVIPRGGFFLERITFLKLEIWILRVLA